MTAFMTFGIVFAGGVLFMLAVMALAWTGLLARLLQTLHDAAPIRFWAMVGASVALTFFSAALVAIVWRGGWHGQESRQLDILGKALWITLGMILIIVVSLTNQKFSAKGLGGSVDLSGQGDEQQQGDK